jgi:hypothetical protein
LGKSVGRIMSLSAGRGLIVPLGLGLCAFVLAGCAAPGDGPAPAATSTAKLSDVFATPDWAKFTGGGDNKPLVQRTVTAEDLISPEGYCAQSAQAAAIAPTTDDSTPTNTEMLQGQDALPQVAGGIALAMTECEVAQRAGMPSRTDIGAEGEVRVTTLTYMDGPWPGIYRFRSGRLVSIDRVDPPAPKKPAPRSRSPR